MAGALQLSAGMLLFRSLTLGLLGAMLFLHLDAERAPALPPPSPPVVARLEGPTIVDVAAEVASEALPALVRMRPGEHVAFVDDRAVDNDLEAGAAISAHRHPFVDIEIATADGGERRVLLLCH